jgi:hypothetical protein
MVSQLYRKFTNVHCHAHYARHCFLSWAVWVQITHPSHSYLLILSLQCRTICTAVSETTVLFRCDYMHYRSDFMEDKHFFFFCVVCSSLIRLVIIPFLRIRVETITSLPLLSTFNNAVLSFLSALSSHPQSSLLSSNGRRQFIFSVIS